MRKLVLDGLYEWLLRTPCNKMAPTSLVDCTARNIELFWRPRRLVIVKQITRREHWTG